MTLEEALVEAEWFLNLKTGDATTWSRIYKFQEVALPKILQALAHCIERSRPGSLE